MTARQGIIEVGPEVETMLCCVIMRSRRIIQTLPALKSAKPSPNNHVYLYCQIIPMTTINLNLPSLEPFAPSALHS